MPRTKPEVFIIESLKFDDEKKQLFEGKILSQILNMHGKKCLYYYIRTKLELNKVLELYQTSNYRYLHFSCHGGNHEMSLTLDAIDFKELGDILRPKLKNKRLFLSACNMVNKNLATNIIPTSGCYSLIGPNNEVDFDSSAIFWASFYHLMFKQNDMSMNMKEITIQLKLLTKLYSVPMSYFIRSTKFAKGYARKNIK
jgi:hypothetical protein